MSGNPQQQLSIFGRIQYAAGLGAVGAVVLDVEETPVFGTGEDSLVELFNIPGQIPCSCPYEHGKGRRRCQV